MGNVSDGLSLHFTSSCVTLENSLNYSELYSPLKGMVKLALPSSSGNHEDQFYKTSTPHTSPNAKHSHLTISTES